MKSLTKHVSVFALIVALLLTIVAGSGLVFDGIAVADVAVSNHSNGYFYKQISKDSRAEKFYKAFENLERNGDFRDGEVEYDLVANEVVSTDDVAGYVDNAESKIPVSYGMGRDAYFMDNPDLFYADVYSTAISAGQNGGQNYVAYLDTSRAETLYYGSLNSRAKVNEAIQAYENKLATIVNGAKEKSSVVEQIRYVNQYIVDNTTYSFGTAVVDGRNVDTDAAAYIYTSYGALVNGQAVCEGYSMAFKAVMDRLNIPCVGVKGYALPAGKSVYTPHMWNYVQVDGLWYAIDVTWNDAGNGSEKWFLMGANTFGVRHTEDGVVSSSNIELKYPALKPYNYGIDTDDNGMDIAGSYFTADNGNRTLKLTVSFEGKGAAKLEEEGKYLSLRTGYTVSGEVIWSAWMNCLGSKDIFEGVFNDSDKNLEVTIVETMEFVQFALIDYAPDLGWNGMLVPPLFVYDEAQLTDEHFISELSAPYKNEIYEEYFPAPGAVTFNPAHAGDLPVNKTYDITVSYNTDLKLVEGKKASDVGIEFYTSNRNDTVHEYAQVSDVVWDPAQPKTIKFKFKPSQMFEHNNVTYYFTPTNLIGGHGDKTPDPFTYSFKGKSVVCSKVFNDGRLYMSVYGQPKMLDTSDLSMGDFKDENGNYYAESQRSQLMLVVNKPDAEQEKEMDDVLKDKTQIKDGDVVSSATYEIDLQICGVVQQVPQGSYMQVSFGFPEGCNPDDEGTTFKIYHYKRDNHNNIIGVEEIPVIVTKYGLIAQVKSFSPFTIVQIKNTSDEIQNSTQGKFIYASVDGKGGSIATQDGKTGIVEVSGNSVTYVINKEAGYQIAQVLLNGNQIDIASIADGTITLDKDDLGANNTLEVKFVTTNSVESYQEKGITIAQVAVEVDSNDLPDLSNPDDGNQGGTTTPETKPAKNNTGLIVGCVIAAVVVCAGVAVLVIFLMKKKRNNAK